LTTVVEEREGGKYAISIKQGLPENGDKELYREQMVDIGVFKIKKVAGASVDEWDEDGDLELCKKVEI
jgi:hypothetical protein